MSVFLKIWDMKKYHLNKKLLLILGQKRFANCFSYTLLMSIRDRQKVGKLR